MRSKIMDIYDKYYDETFNQIMLKVRDRSKAKELIGRIFRETSEDMVAIKHKSIEIGKDLFEKNKVRYGIC